jgi:uncharacterized membrane protein YcaP (DUF421 family)
MDLVYRTVVAFVLVVFVTRIAGKRELSSMEPFDIVLLVVMGDLIQQGVTQNDFSLTGTAIVLAVLTLMTVALAYLNFRFGWLRPLLEGGVVVLIEEGKLNWRNLKRERLTVEEVEAQARLTQIESLDKVRLAILENNGRISFIPADE